MLDSKSLGNLGQDLDVGLPGSPRILDAETQVWDGGEGAGEAPGKALPPLWEIRGLREAQAFTGRLMASEAPTDFSVISAKTPS